MKSFFQPLESHEKQGIPFVVYRKPHERSLHAFLQEDDKTHVFSGVSQSGFVFAPFHNSQPALMLPASCSKQLIWNEYEPEALFSEPLACFETVHRPDEREKHLRLVEKGIQAIREGQFQKVVLSRPQAIRCEGISAVSIFKKLACRYPAAFCYAWFHPKTGCWAGASPELLLSLEENRLQTMALAGTQVFQDGVEVVWGEKERAEQQWVTDFIISCLERTAKEVKHSAAHTVQAGNLLHLQTDITASVNPQTFRLSQLLAELHPTPAVCGFPKEEALQFILENEGYSRDFYSGFLGEFALETDSSRFPQTRLYVNLRCMRLEAQGACAYAGGGITEDSEPVAEWVETERKLDTLLQVLR